MRKVIMRSRWYVLGFLVLALATVPVWGSEYVVLFCMLFCLYLAFAQMWNLLIGYSGLFSLAQPVFIGLTGYTMAVMTSYYGSQLWISLLLGGVLSVAFALFMSLFIFRMKGIYFGIITLLFAELMALLFSNWEYVKYSQGMFIKPAHPPSMSIIYWGAFVLGTGSVVLVYGILRSKLGLGLMAMRDDEEAANSTGVEIFRSKLYCFLLAAFTTGLTGGMYYTYQIFIMPYEAFSIGWSIKMIFMVVIGGIGTIEGPIVGAFVFVLLSQWLAEYFSVSMLILGGIAITVILVAPKGIMGTLQEKLCLEFLSPRRT
ncbi:MAG: branched-chain amino acid ABC transporter permease [Deltaproteobacteria bacterium]|nr:branched-chain amino acid ABC transporter permease [Deltaproteobacteria bacterium]MBW2009282.1 branched-chain amino acid ABC transporter permease [Deltaproteobacteria bacterium]